MTSADVSVRLAWPDDAAAIAAVQARVWQAAYADLLADESFQELAPDDLADRWAMLITAPSDAKIRVLVALEVTELRGYALVHPCHDADADQVGDGEIGEFSIDPDHLRRGHGSRLMQACADTLRSDGFRRAVWWQATTDDELRAFCLSAGWAADGAHRSLEAEGGAVLKQVRLHTALVD